MTGRRILATDLDRTLLPNGRWPADAAAIPLFNALTRRRDLLLVYVTGRNLALTEQAIATYGLRHPDVLCGDVGSTIRHYRDGDWQADPGWNEVIRRASPQWDAAAVTGALAGIAGLREQEPEHLNPFKQSYYVDHARCDAILREVDAQIAGRFDAAVVYSVDTNDGRGLLDVLPDSATKRTALEYVVSTHGAARDDVVFCGDSGNDILPLTAGFCGVLVKNADEQLVRSVDDARRQQPELRVYVARGDFQGLNGYYASGVIEGCYHYGLFTDPEPGTG